MGYHTMCLRGRATSFGGNYYVINSLVNHTLVEMVSDLAIFF